MIGESRSALYFLSLESYYYNDACTLAFHQRHRAPDCSQYWNYNTTKKVSKNTSDDLRCLLTAFYLEVWGVPYKTNSSSWTCYLDDSRYLEAQQQQSCMRHPHSHYTLRSRWALPRISQFAQISLKTKLLIQRIPIWILCVLESLMSHSKILQSPGLDSKWIVYTHYTHGSISVFQL